MFKAFVRKHIRNLCLKRVRAKKQSFPQCFVDGWRMVGHGLQMVEQWLANGWTMVGQWLADGWPPTHGGPMAGQWLKTHQNELLMAKHVLLFIPVIPQLYKSLDSVSFQLKSSRTRVFNTSPGIYHGHGKIKAIARMHLQLHLMHLQSQQQ